MSSSHAEELEALLRSSKAPIPADLKPILARLSTEVRERMEQNAPASYGFFTTTATALSRIRGTANSDLRLDCLFNAGQFFSRSGYHSNALSVARSIGDLATRTGSKAWFRKGEVLAGIVHGELGDVTESVVRHANALAIAVELDDPMATGATLTGLSAAFIYSALFNEALRCSERAIVFLEQTTDPKASCAFAYTNIAQSYLHLEDYTSGFRAINVALDLAGDVRDVLCGGLFEVT